MPLSLFRYEKSQPYLRHCYEDCKTETEAKMAGRYQHHSSMISVEVKNKNKKILFQ